MNDTRKALMRMRANLRRRLTADEKESIDAYANLIDPAPGFVMNRILRSLPLSEPRSTIDVAKHYIKYLDAALAKAYEFPNKHVKVLYRGVRRAEVARWSPGTVRTFKAFMSTSYLPAQAFIYQRCCVIVVHGSGVHKTKFVYSPNEDEIVLDRGTKLRLLSIKKVKTTQDFWKHPHIPIEHHPPFGGTVTIYDAVIVGEEIG